MSRKRSISATVSAVVEEHRLEKMLQRHRNYSCIDCGKSTAKEVMIEPKHLRIEDCDIKHIVAYRIKCPHRAKPTLHDKILGCSLGNADAVATGSCATCAYAEPVQVRVRPVQVNQHTVEYKCYRILYRCTNQPRMEQFPKDTHMCAYIRCEHYKKRGK